MAVTIGSNISSLQAQRRLGESTSSISSVFERLSSGKRINRASDGAAELAIATSLNADTRVYTQGLRNGNDGLSLLSIADEALKNLSDIVVRITELATQSANGVYSNKQRKPLDDEAQALAAEYLRITQTTEFNGIKLFDGSLGDGVWLQLGYSGVTANIGGAISSGEYGAPDLFFFGTGAFPIAVNTADLNGDGVTDIVSADRNPATASILIGNGDGSFQDRTTLAGGLPSGFAEGLRNAIPVDLNNDGFLDLALAGYNIATTFINKGDGTFQSAKYTTISPNPYASEVYQFTAADINDDGFNDLITADKLDNTAKVLLGKGDGTFQSAISVSTGSYPTSVAAGDINRDGKLDLVATNWAADTVSVVLGNGDGTFLPQTTLTAGDGPHSINLEDFNGDGFLDILNSNEYESSVSMMLGNGDGTFQTRNIIGASAGSLASTAADINGDGIMDVVAGDTDSNSATIFLGKGDGTFRSGSTVTMGTTGPRYVTTGDLNGDGVLDIVTAQRREDSISVSIAQTVSGRGALLDFSLESRADSLQALGMLGQALTNINKQRGVIGGSMSRIAVAMSNLEVGRGNFAAAESRIRDTDVAADTAALIASRIVQQSGAAILAQSNQQPEIALKLLGI